MEILNKAYDRACCEVEDILNHPTLDKQDVELLGNFVDIIKDVEMIYDYQDKMDGYSQMNGNSYNSYMRGNSGRMSSYNNRNSYGRNRSMNNGYSGNDSREMMIDQLHDVASMATDEKDRKAVDRLIQQMQNRE